MKCPSCGGDLKVPTFQSEVVCSFCGNKFLLRQDYPSYDCLKKAANYLKLALAKADSHKFQEALEYVDKAIEEDGGNFSLWIHRAAWQWQVELDEDLGETWQHTILSSWDSMACTEAMSLAPEQIKTVVRAGLAEIFATVCSNTILPHILMGPIKQATEADEQYQEARARRLSQSGGEIKTWQGALQAGATLLAETTELNNHLQAKAREDIDLMEKLMGLTRDFLRTLSSLSPDHEKASLGLCLDCLRKGRLYAFYERLVKGISDREDAISNDNSVSDAARQPYKDHALSRRAQAIIWEQLWEALEEMESNLKKTKGFKPLTSEQRAALRRNDPRTQQEIQAAEKLKAATAEAKEREAKWSAYVADRRLSPEEGELHKAIYFIIGDKFSDQWVEDVKKVGWYCPKCAKRVEWSSSRCSACGTSKPSGWVKTALTHVQKAYALGQPLSTMLAQADEAKKREHLEKESLTALQSSCKTKSIVSIVLGIAGVCTWGITGVIAIILAMSVLNAAKKQGGTVVNTGAAKWGLWLGIASACFGLLATIAALLPNP
jgi:predicted RNA-binding Zn-ribbon protein involved in translation (DUF1610 family)